MKFLTWLFACRHPKLTWPIRLDGQPATMACLVCGKRIVYEGGVGLMVKIYRGYEVKGEKG